MFCWGKLPVGCSGLLFCKLQQVKHAPTKEYQVVFLSDFGHGLPTLLHVFPLALLARLGPPKVP